LRDADITRIARHQLDKLAEQTGESVLLGILEDDSVLYLNRGEAPRRLRRELQVDGLPVLAAFDETAQMRHRCRGRRRRSRAGATGGVQVREEFGVLLVRAEPVLVGEIVVRALVPCRRINSSVGTKSSEGRCAGRGWSRRLLS
jgi:hypothetical protein